MTERSISIDQSPAAPSRPHRTVPPAVKQIISPRAHLMGGTLKYHDLLGYFLLPSDDSVIRRYEKRIADFLGVKSAFSYDSGRSALMELLRALGIGAGDEVVIPGYTCMAVPAAIMNVGATPKYVDIDRKTFNMDPALVEAALTPRSKVLIAQHSFGLPCDLDALSAIAERHGLLLIEDFAHAIGAKFRGKYCGSYGVAGYSSTEHSKMISTMKGGLVTTNDADLAAKLEQSQAKLEPYPQDRVDGCVARWMTEIFVCDPRLGGLFELALRRVRKSRLEPKIQHSTEFDLDEFSDLLDAVIRPAARLPSDLSRIGLLQVPRIEADIVKRNKVARALEHLAPKLGWQPPEIDWAHARPSFVRYPFLVDNKAEWQNRLGRAGIEHGVWFSHPIHPVGSHHQKVGYESGMCPNAEYVTERMLNIPLHPRTAGWILDRLQELASA